MNRFLLSALLLTSTFVLNCNCDPVEELARVPTPGAITGKFCAPSGNQGIGGARIYIITERDEVFETLSDTDGTFLLEDLPDGEYTVYLQSGSFRTNVQNVAVVEETITELEDEECIQAEDPTVFVYDGHDTIQYVLDDIGIEYTLKETHTQTDPDERPVESWMLEHFSSYESIADADILFINCGAHEWSFEFLSEEDEALVFGNLKRFVDEGKAIYVSDWSYDILEKIYPDAVDWLGEDTVLNAAEHAGDFHDMPSQTLKGTVVDPSMEAFLGKAEVDISIGYTVAIPQALGPNTRALITADVYVTGESNFTNGQPDIDSNANNRPDPATGSCEGICGGQADSGCWCNEACVEHGDCCSDYASACSGGNGGGAGGANSCQGKCGDDYDPELNCQCNDRCAEFGNCCDDYNSVCGGGSNQNLTNEFSCANACGGDRRWASCQCTPECLKDGRETKGCCADFDDVCTLENEGTVLTEVPILLEYLPGESALNSGRVIFTSFHNNDDNAGDLGKVLEGIIYSL